MKRRACLLLPALLPLAALWPRRATALELEAVEVPGGPFLYGSTREEREYAYRLDEQAYGHSITREQRWYENEPPLATAELPAFAILRDPVTNEAYARFVRDTGHPPPRVDAAEWAAYGLIHPYERTLRHQWLDGRPPPGRERHPVVLVSHTDAQAFAAWLRSVTGEPWRLPSEREWEKAARGVAGWYFPWGFRFDPGRLNSADGGPFDTVPVGSYPLGASPFGMRDAAGQVFEWTATEAGPGRYIVKGGSWDDRGCGVCRPAARHGRPAHLKHILIGFRLVRSLEE